ncbi:3-hydroxyacyl-CoA dehydrogenase family protein [Streptomyces sp. NPDC058475]|uniref:3-hydroxyacyl-CoA dehydrogenase family protein n=1 Tax=Streptomyces sp. NPDC058475 TaxID=3346518 RepID=UPI0036608999
MHLKKKPPAHVANRLQAALYREVVVHLIEQGVLDVADSDDAVSWGPGLRWGCRSRSTCSSTSLSARCTGPTEGNRRDATP